MFWEPATLGKSFWGVHCSSLFDGTGARARLVPLSSVGPVDFQCQFHFPLHFPPFVFATDGIRENEVSFLVFGGVWSVHHVVQIRGGPIFVCASHFDSMNSRSLYSIRIHFAAHCCQFVSSDFDQDVLSVRPLRASLPQCGLRQIVSIS